MRKIISSLGVELEGVMPDSEVNQAISFLRQKYESKGLIKGLDVHHDGSIDVPSYDYTDVEITFWSPSSNYEYISQLYGEIFDNLAQKFSFEQNASCGNHMHLKLSSTVYYFILSLPSSISLYKQKFLERFKNNRKYLNRLNNRYSKDFENLEDIADNQQGGDRYHFINFSSLYKHSDTQTVEIRVMPWAQDGREYQEMVQFNLNTVDDIVWKNYLTAKKYYLREHGRELYFKSTKYYSASLINYLWGNLKDRLILTKIKKIAEKIQGVRINLDENGISIYHSDEFIKRVFESYINQNLMYKQFDSWLIRDGHRREVLEYLLKLLKFERYGEKENVFNNTWFQDVLLSLRLNHPHLDFNYLHYYLIMYNRLAQLFS